eukprot:903-Amphidinium_carterae.1
MLVMNLSQPYAVFPRWWALGQAATPILVECDYGIEPQIIQPIQHDASHNARLHLLSSETLATQFP